MKNKKTRNQLLAVLCACAIFAGFLPAGAIASELDLSEYYKQVAEYQAQIEAQAQQVREAYAQSQAQMEEYYAQLKAMQEEQTSEKNEKDEDGEDDSFDPELAYKFMLQLKTGELKELFFNSLTKVQQRKLILYLRDLRDKGEFTGFEDFDLSLELPGEEEPAGEEPAADETSDEEAPADEEEPAEDETPAEEEPVEEEPEADEITAEEAAAIAAAEKAAEEEAFRTAYQFQIELYRQYGNYADLSYLPYETQLKVMACANDKPIDSVKVSDEDKDFAAQYGIYMDIYRLFGEDADLGAVPEDVRVRIKALVDAENAPEEPAEEEPAEEEPLEEEPAEEEPAEEEPADEELAEEEPAEEEPAEEETIEEEPAEEEEPADEVYSAAVAGSESVTILSSLGDTVSPGDLVTLTGILEDADSYGEVIYVWEVDKGSGEYEAVPEADGATYSFPASVDSLGWNWRLSVYYR